jgi:exopolyphosphatase/guanosine-5'-triphosphate,3'-diphosphate pyrophosphatase
VRRASNGGEFIERVRRETGIALDIISAREEARLAVLGCHILIDQAPGRRWCSTLAAARPNWC